MVTADEVFLNSLFFFLPLDALLPLAAAAGSCASLASRLLQACLPPPCACCPSPSLPPAMTMSAFSPTINIVAAQTRNTMLIILLLKDKTLLQSTNNHRINNILSSISVVNKGVSYFDLSCFFMSKCTA